MLCSFPGFATLLLPLLSNWQCFIAPAQLSTGRPESEFFLPALWWLNMDRRQGLTDLYTDKLLLATLSKIVLIFMGYRLNLMYHVIAYVTLNLFSPVWWQTIQTFSLSGLSLGDFVGRWQSHHSQPFSTTGRHSQPLLSPGWHLSYLPNLDSLPASPFSQFNLWQLHCAFSS